MNEMLMSLREFRSQRLRQITSGWTPVKLRDGLHTVVHVVPFTALEAGISYDDASLSIYHRTRELRPIYSSRVSTSRYDFDGFLLHGQIDASGAAGSYLQVFWSGALESVNTLAKLDPSVPPGLPALEFEEQLLARLPSYMGSLRSLGCGSPIFIAISLLGTVGYSMEIPSPATFEFAPEHGGRIESEQVVPPEVVAEDFECDFGRTLKPAFDAIWKAAGWKESLFYDGDSRAGLAKYFPG